MKDPPFSCQFHNCTHTTDELGRLDDGHIYCPGHLHSSESIIHFNGRDWEKKVGMCRLCSYIALEYKTGRTVFYKMKRYPSGALLMDPDTVIDLR